MKTSTKIYLTFVFCSVCLFSTLGGRTLENIDYIKYAEISREILELNDWTVLHLNGNIYVDKPPFHFWNIALCYLAFGVNAFAARFPSALFSLITLMAVLLFTIRETKSVNAGVLSCLILLSSYGFFFFSHRTRIDIEYGAIFFLSLFAFYEGMKGARHRCALFALFWLLTGIGFMYKGPVIFLNLLIVTAYWITARKKKFPCSPVAPFLLTLPIALFPAVPWLYKLYNHPDFATYLSIFKDKNIMTRNAGILYYVPELIKKFFPAILFAPLAYKVLKKHTLNNRKAAPFIWFLTLWFSLIFIVLHIPAAKTHRYLIPIYPPLAILTGLGLTIALKKGLYQKYLKWPGRVLGPVTACALTVAPFIIWIKFGFQLLPFIISFLMIMSLSLSWKKNIGKIYILFLCIPAIYLYVDFFSAMRNDKTSEIARAYTILTENGIAPDEVVMFPDCGWKRNILSFYCNRLVDCKDTAEDVKKYRAVIVDKKDNDAIKLNGYKKYTISSHKHTEDDKYVFIKNNPSE